MCIYQSLRIIRLPYAYLFGCIRRLVFMQVVFKGFCVENLNFQGGQSRYPEKNETVSLYRIPPIVETTQTK